MTNEQDEKRPDFGAMAWPDVPRVMFGPADDWHLNACVGEDFLNRDRTGAYLDGYVDAAQVLFERAATDRVYAPTDTVIYPLAFLWRHAIELGLKEIVRLGMYVASDGEEEYRPKRPNHGLLSYWNEAKPHIIATNPEHPDAPEILNAEDLIRQLVAVDPYADGWRYAKHSDGTADTLATLPPLVNLRQMHEAMGSVARFLRAVRSELDRRVDWINEMQAQMRAEYESQMRDYHGDDPDNA